MNITELFGKYKLLSLTTAFSLLVFKKADATIQAWYGTKRPPQPAIEMISIPLDTIKTMISLVLGLFIILIIIIFMFYTKTKDYQKKLRDKNDEKNKKDTEI